MTVIYCAPWVWPGATAIPIEDGAVVVEGELIAAIGQSSVLRPQFQSARVENLADAVILPGLINAHSHLELTAMRGFLESEETDFVAWLKKLTLARLERMTTDDLYVSAAWGAAEAARAGITCLGDASSAAYESMSALRDVGLRGTVFQESFGPDPRLARENLISLESQISRLRPLETSRVRVGVSPHAPYTVSALQLKLIAELALADDLPLMMHAAESAAEDLLIRQGEGAFAKGLLARGIQWQAPGLSPIQHLEVNGVLRTQPLLAHCIRVNDDDIKYLADTKSRVAHCPKSNAKLGHGRAPLGKLLTQGVVVGLGTDSVASNNVCDLLDEARFATLAARLDCDQRTRPLLTAAMALKLATAGGASALGLENKTGELKAGLQADLAIVSLAGTHQLPSFDPLGTMLFAASGRDVILTVVAGRQVFANGRVTTIDEAELRQRMKTLQAKLIAGN